MSGPHCPNNPAHEVLLIEYPHNVPEHYDGISEIECLDCKKRYGRWTLKELAPEEREPRFGIEGLKKTTVVVGPA